MIQSRRNMLQASLRKPEPKPKRWIIQSVTTAHSIVSPLSGRIECTGTVMPEFLAIGGNASKAGVLRRSRGGLIAALGIIDARDNIALDGGSACRGSSWVSEYCLRISAGQMRDLRAWTVRIWVRPPRSRSKAMRALIKP